MLLAACKIYFGLNCPSHMLGSDPPLCMGRSRKFVGISSEVRPVAMHFGIFVNGDALRSRCSPSSFGRLDGPPDFANSFYRFQLGFIASTFVVNATVNYIPIEGYF